MNRPTPSAEVVAALAPNGVLRAGTNMSNFLLVSGRTPDDGPAGVSPDMARSVADALGASVEYVTFERPGPLADAATQDKWDIGLIAVEPKRAEHIAFSPAYTEIESTYMVPAGSPLTSIAKVDAKGVRIAVAARAAYDLWLERNIQHAELVRAEGLDASFELFVNDQLDALAGLRPKLVMDVAKLPGATVLEGRFTAVQQAVGTPRARGEAAAAFLRDFVEYAKASGMVASLIKQHGVEGLSVAPPAA